LINSITRSTGPAVIQVAVTNEVSYVKRIVGFNDADI